MDNKGIIALAVFARDVAGDHDIESAEDLCALLGVDVEPFPADLSPAEKEALGAQASKWLNELADDSTDVGLRLTASEALSAAEDAPGQAAGILLGLEWPVLFGLIVLLRVRKIRLGKLLEAEFGESKLANLLGGVAAKGDESGAVADALLDAASKRGEG